jgi:outer membrane protein assembly factor BamB
MSAMRNSKNTYKLLAWLMCVGTVVSLVLGQPGSITFAGGARTINLDSSATPDGGALNLESNTSQLIMQTASVTLSNRILLPVVTNPKVVPPTLTPTPQPSLTPTPTPNPGSTVGWSMAGANPQRTSWTSAQVPSAEYMAAHRNDWNNGKLYPQWAKPIGPYIPQKVQIIAANDTLYVSTARGLYALNPATGAEKWLFPTELPLGHSPTVVGNVAYVGGMDHRLYAIDAITGALLWSYDGAGAGFDTNPLVLGSVVYAGNRDGYMYAVYANTHPQKGQLAWKYKTNGSIHFSAASDGANIYFASDDSYAYALNAVTGALVWKSAKLPGAGFRSWWPVVYGNVVIFPGSSNYRDNVRPGASSPFNIDQLDREVVSNPPAASSSLRGEVLGPRGADGWINTAQSAAIGTGTSNISKYFEAKPWRRTYFVLDKSTGREITYDFNGDGKAEYAPFLWAGTQSGNRFPPAVGSDGVIYQATNIYYDSWINGGGIAGWRIGTPYISTPSAGWHPTDEPMAFAIGGNIVYWNDSGNQRAGAFDLSVPNTRFIDIGQSGDVYREWAYWDNGLDEVFPGFPASTRTSQYGGTNGSYDNSGDQNPPIPYQGRVYVHRGNAVIALGQQQVTPVVLSTAPAGTPQAAVILDDVDSLKQELVQEVQKIVAAGHLRPGFLSSGHVDLAAQSRCADEFQNYFHNPADTLYALVRALPHLPPDLAQQTRAYLQAEYAAYPPLSVTNIGWKNGANRQAFDLPPEVESDTANLPAQLNYGGFQGWPSGSIPPFTFYTLWKYAQTFGGAQQIFAQAKGLLPAVPSDAVLAEYPFAHNDYIAGYIGYVELAKLAGDNAEASSKQGVLNTLLAKRAANFNKDTPYVNGTIDSSSFYCRAFSSSRNFIDLVPELGNYLHDNALAKVQTAVNEYNQVTPYWFAAAFEDTINEGVSQPLYDVIGVFGAKALILKQSRAELVKYLDAPAFARGDLFYIHKLVLAIEAP